jgi:hypothetical protein
VLLALAALAGQLGRLRIGRAAGDGVALALVGVVDLLALDGDLAVGLVPHLGRAELGVGALVVAVVALAAAEGHVLALVGGPLVEVGWQAVPVLPLLHGLLSVLVLLLCLLGRLVRLGLALAAVLGFGLLLGLTRNPGRSTRDQRAATRATSA